MNAYTKHNILTAPELLLKLFKIKVMGLDVNYHINHGKDGRIKGLFEFNNKVIHGVSIDGHDIDRGLEIIETKIKDKIYSAEICQYCGKETRFDIIHREYHCDPCGAKIGCHIESAYKSLGSVGNYELRELRSTLHYYFDKLWKYSFERGIIKRPERGLDDEHARSWRTKCRMTAYKWLALKLNIEEKYCHIGMFNDEQCEEALGIAVGYNKELDIYYNETRNMVLKNIITFKKDLKYGK